MIDYPGGGGGDWRTGIAFRVGRSRKSIAGGRWDDGIDDLVKHRDRSCG